MADSRMAAVDAARTMAATKASTNCPVSSCSPMIDAFAVAAVEICIENKEKIV